MARVRLKSCVVAAVLVLLIFVITTALKSLRPAGSVTGSPFGLGLLPHLSKMDKKDAETHVPEQVVVAEVPPAGVNRKSPGMETPGLDASLKNLPAPNYNLHAFYYTWYGNPQFDGKYIHWDHPVVPHWDPKVDAGYPKGRHSPPEDIGANFYPALGAYSSRDPSVVEAHMLQLRTAAVGVLALSWYPPGMKDDNGEPTDDIVPLVLDLALKYQLKVVFHIEPYKGRDAQSMFTNIKYIVEKYGNHPAFYRYKSSSGAPRPLFYIYDSYLVGPDEWAGLLKDTGHHSVRNTPYDGLFVALLVEEKHKNDILTAGFDGVYTYFATNGFTYGSSHSNWRSIKGFCDRNELLFIPSVGPGYMDTSIRPWNGQNTRHRINGKYYETALGAAVDVRADIISITSFNEWHEGTQIEKAIPKTAGKTVYQDYLPHKSDIYLEVTRKWSDIFVKEREKWLM
ncbi:glycoprotein endo-alpha-1,2-mannosidase [Scleropages formosus]|uniref:Glycoprotein endo-alpha-1,2-mannosidase n=1 Tax=Scleropages formosus TaxID=113540 RepID=A0A8C9RSW1_SCLFO|nr:glycoprotein endo-alpha-1,2-mannosidase-like [Scleropages formosus]XP_029114595.1 glycoprotein endo-alpha-1,2-mannosidase-like [Scleropages formosus]